MDKKVLIAAPVSLVKLESFLVGKSLDTCHVATGKGAQLEISNGDYSAIIIADDIENHPLGTVLSYINTKFPDVPTVVLSDDQEIFENFDFKRIKYITRSRNDAPPKHILSLLSLESNQFENSEPLTKTVSDEESIVEDDDKFSRIRIKDFISGKVVQFDVFVKLAGGRYVKILHTGDSFSKSRISKYAKKTDFLYILEKDRGQYIEFSNYLLDKLADKQVPAKTKLSLAKNAMEKFTESLYEEGFEPKIILKGKKICNSIHKLISSDDTLYKSFNCLYEINPDIYTHAYLTALFSSMIAFNSDIKSAASIETMTMAAMLHDIGLTEIPEEIAQKKPSDMDPEELKIYQTHPARGAKLIEESKLLSNTIPQVVMQHHEASDGSGFPRGLKDIRLQMLSKIVFLADSFSCYIIENDLRPYEGLKEMVLDQDIREKFNQNVLRNFIKLFIDPEKRDALGSAYSKNSKVKSA